MAIISGELVAPDKLKVLSTVYTTDNAPDGWYSVPTESIPEYPAPQVGVNHVMYFNPQDSTFSFEQEPRELTQEEKVDQLQASVDMLILDALMGGN